MSVEVSYDSLMVEDHFPRCAMLKQLEARKDLELIDISEAFPIFRDVEALGRRGKPFDRHMKARLFFNAKDTSVIGLIYFPVNVEGPPGSVHGGMTAMTFDSCFGTLVLRAIGWGFLTISLNITYKKRIPLGSIMKIDVRIEKQEGRKYWLRSEISDPNSGEVHAESNALFYRKFPEQGSWQSAIRKYGANSGITKEAMLQMIEMARKKNEMKPKL